MLSRRQIRVQRENLASMCRISVKALLDYACLYTHVNDDSEEFINFCAVFEQLVSHRLRPYQKKVWLPGEGSPRHFWDVLLENYNRTRGFFFQTCIPNIEAIETIKSPKAKLRAFIRVALMEKRLSDYLYWLLDNTNLISESYLDGALLASEDAAILCGGLIGLNAVDFNFCLKGSENELLGPLEVSYGPFLKYKQISASRCSDEIEMLRLREIEAEEDRDSITESDIGDILQLHTLEKDVRQIKEQKDYLEELVRLRDRQLADIRRMTENMKAERQAAERDREKERITMEACVLELHAELAKVRKENDSLKAQVIALKQYKQKMEQKEVAVTDSTKIDSKGSNRHEILVEMEQVGRSLAHRKESPSVPADQRSINSLVSNGQPHFKEDSQSMIPLTGSLADVNKALLDSNLKEYFSEEMMVAVPTPTSGPEHEGTESYGDESKESLQMKTILDHQIKHSDRGDHTCRAEKDFVTTPKALETEELYHLNGQIKKLEQEVTESYYMTQSTDLVNPFQQECLNSSVEVADAAVNSADEFVDSDLLAGGDDKSNQLTEGDNQVMTQGREVYLEQEKEDDGAISDPELVVHPGNISSDSSDAAWEMVSNSSQHSDHDEEKV